MITGSGFNPITQQKLREALSSYKGGSLVKGATLSPEVRCVLSAPSQHTRLTSFGPQQPKSGGGEAETLPTPSSPSVGTKKAKALYPYTAVKDSQLDMSEGDVLTVLDDNKKWWRVIQDRTGLEGEVNFPCL